MEKMQRILFVGAHPDDIEICAGGAAARFAQSDKKVFFLTMTHGDKDDPRSNESHAAAGTLGIHRNIMWDDVDGAMVAGSHMVGDLDKLISKYGIDTIITHSSLDVHNDHIETLKLCQQAGRNVENFLQYMPVPFPRTYQGNFANHNLFVELSSEQLDLKLRAIQSHVSQFNRFPKGWPGLVKAQMRYFGGLAGCQYAECFHVSKLKF